MKFLKGILVIVAIIVIGLLIRDLLIPAVDKHYEDMYAKVIDGIKSEHALDRADLLSQIEVKDIDIQVGKEEIVASGAKIEGLQRRIFKLLNPPSSLNLSVECKRILAEVNEAFRLLVVERDELWWKNVKLVNDLEAKDQKKDELIASHKIEKTEIETASTSAIKEIVKDYSRKIKKLKILAVILAILAAASAL